jgi:6-phosphogluconolactonase
VTFPLLEHARAVLLLVTGASKAAALADVLEGAWNPEHLPSQRLGASAGGVEWFLDEAAASRLRERFAT